MKTTLSRPTPKFMKAENIETKGYSVNIPLAKTTKKELAQTKPIPSKTDVIYNVSPFSLDYLGFNRGRNANKEQEQFKRSRVDNLMGLMESREFLWELSDIKAIERNGRLVIFDGHNRVQSVIELIEKGFYKSDFTIPVKVIKNSVLCKMSEKELARIVSIMSDYDPRWKEPENMATGMIFKLLTAQELTDYKRIFDAKGIIKSNPDKKGKESKLVCSYNWIYALANNDPSFVKAHKKITYSLLMDDSIGKKMKTKEFQEKFESFCKCMANAAKWESARPSEYISHIIYHGNGCGFDKLAKAIKNSRSPKSEKELPSFFYMLVNK